MIVLRNGIKVYYPKLSIKSCLAIHQIFGDVTKPLFSFTSVATQMLLLSLSLQQYNITEEELYELMDSVGDINSLILELYSECGLIGIGERQNSLESICESESDNSSEPITFESYMLDLLQQCMSIGMREEDFFNSTLAQITRYVESYRKTQEEKLQEKAYFDYQLANLIGMSVARLMDKNAKYPEFNQAYPFLNKEADSKELEGWELEKQHLKLREWAEQMNRKLDQEEKE